jgi:hypothetical protein
LVVILTAPSALMPEPRCGASVTPQTGTRCPSLGSERGPTSYRRR